jgi:hypothetical protein
MSAAVGVPARSICIKTVFKLEEFGTSMMKASGVWELVA